MNKSLTKKNLFCGRLLLGLWRLKANKWKCEEGTGKCTYNNNTFRIEESINGLINGGFRYLTLNLMICLCRSRYSSEEDVGQRPVHGDTLKLQ